MGERIVVNLAEIAMPKTYLRSKINPGHVNEFVDRLKAAEAEAGKDKPVVIPFPDIALRLVDENQAKPGIKYELMDGVHRVQAYIRRKMLTVPAENFGTVSDADAMLFQFRRTFESGLRFKKVERDAAIRTFYRMALATGITAADVSRLTGLSEPTISRILKPREDAEKAEKPWSAEKYFDRFAKMLSDAEEHLPELSVALGKVGKKAEKRWFDAAGALREILDAMENAKGEAPAASNG